jgi:hypothetical protein
MMYQDQAHKNNALRDLLRHLVDGASGPLPGDPDMYNEAAARQKAYDDAATRLCKILDTPVAGPAPDPVQLEPGTLELVFEPQDMCVVIVTPAGVLGKDMPRDIVFGPNDDVPVETLAPFHKLIIGAMLDHAREQLDG